MAHPLRPPGDRWATKWIYVEREQVVVVHSAMVLVHGIHKKTQKTPPTDIALVQRRMKEGT